MSDFAFDTYEDLKGAVADWLMRQDLESRIPQFISLTESHLSRVLRVREMIQRRNTVAEDRYITLPSEWRKAKNVQRLSDGRPLGIMAYEEIDTYRADIAAGIQSNPGKGPEFFALVGNTMELAPSPTKDAPAEIEMIYYANVPRLSEEEQSSWLLTRYPDVYLYGALSHSAPFLREDERLGTWQALYREAVMTANESDADARYSGAPLTRRVRPFGG